ncbi:class I SAM-dependent methyltransferase [Alteribacter salitolerans]|uniref:class I SAM-dependent methyltransferase n=1 Tax=Alteribacter salitolerans TaxID=2912333 RepID=UPI003013AA8F
MIQVRKFSSSEFDERVDFFDRMARTKWLGSLHEELIRATGTWKGKRILDVGCGTGRLLMRGAEDTTEVTGVDLSPCMIERSKQLFGETKGPKSGAFLTADAEALPFPGNSFSITVSVCVLFLMPDPEKVLSEMARVTYGTVALLNPSRVNGIKASAQYVEKHRLTGEEKDFLIQWGRVAEHRHRFSENELTQMMERCGWRNVVHANHLDGLALLTTAQRAY